MNHLMRLWYFPSSVNSFLNAHARPSSGARCLMFGLLPQFMCANRQGSGETARDAQARLSHRWDSRLCDKYQNLLSWLKFHSNQDSLKMEDHSYVGPSPNKYGTPV